MKPSGQPFQPDQSMLALFRKQLSEQALKLQDALTLLKGGHRSQVVFDALEMTAKNIISSAHIIQFASLVDLVFALEGLLMHLKKQSTSNLSKYFPLLTLVVDHLKAIAEMDASLLALCLNGRNEETDKIAKRLSAASTDEVSSDILHANIQASAETEGPIDPALMGLFRIELENQTNILSSALLSLEENGEAVDTYDKMLRAIHSIKGGARVVNLDQIAHFSHIVEDVLIAAKEHRIFLEEKSVDVIFRGIDFLVLLSHHPQATLSVWLSHNQGEIDHLTAAFKNLLLEKSPLPLFAENSKFEKFSGKAMAMRESVIHGDDHTNVLTEHPPERVVRVTAESLNRLMGLAGESLVESRWLPPFSEALLRIKKNLAEISSHADSLKTAVKKNDPSDQLSAALKQLAEKSNECHKNISAKLSELEHFINRNSGLSDRLYHEVIHSRMRSFGDIVKAFPRMIRDLAHQLGKKVHFEIRGKSTPVDRDILEALETPLTHLLRNAVDHGIEPPAERVAAGKTPEGNILLEAEHRAGMLSITVSDDGAGVDVELIRKLVIGKGLVSSTIAAKLTDNELIDFLFLPGFSTLSQVTEISGRGVGLNAVQNMIQTVSGSIHCSYIPKKGIRFNLQLPLTLSVIRALVVEISNEPYAVPLSRIERAITIPQEQVEFIENRQYFHLEGKNIGIISGCQILGFEEKKHLSSQLSIVIVTDRLNSYGIVVDSFLGEKELVLHSIDSRLGKVADISSGAFMEDGSPILIIDVEDVVRTIDQILVTGKVFKLSYAALQDAQKQTKRILVIDDSITVREVECRLLRKQGYTVDTAVNGMEGWNALRMGTYDLVVTDVDMPRLNGIDLVRMIRADPRLKSLPVMIVSYKEREEDRIKGLEAGANYYLTKSGFHDQALLNAVVELIGEA